MNLVLIGFRGAGKTTISKILSEKLGMSYCSSDEIISEEENKTINEIIESDGWKYFREKECAVIEKLADKDNCIIDTGAGVIEDSINIDNLKKRGIIIFVYVNLKDVKTRILKSHLRPKLNPLLNIEDDIIIAYNRRLPLYEEVMDFKVNTSLNTPEECAKQIISHLGFNLNSN